MDGYVTNLPRHPRRIEHQFILLVPKLLVLYPSNAEDLADLDLKQTMEVAHRAVSRHLANTAASA